MSKLKTSCAIQTRSPSIPTNLKERLDVERIKGEEF